MIEYSNKEAHRIIHKWLNEDLLCDIDRVALSTLLHHYVELVGHYDEYSND